MIKLILVFKIFENLKIWKVKNFQEILQNDHASLLKYIEKILE